MSLRSNYAYIRDWVNTLFLKKTDIDLDQYYTKEEVDDEVDSARVDTSLYMSKEEYQPEEEVIASALIDLNSRINSVTEDNINGFIGEDEEKVIALALTDLDERVNSIGESLISDIQMNGSSVTNNNGTVNLGTVLTSHQSLSSYAHLESPTFTGVPKAPTAAAGTNDTQIATTAFVNTAISNSTSTKINSGTSRPTLTAVDIGYVFLDTTLGKPIWWNGSAWIDATGATV